MLAYLITYIVKSMKYSELSWRQYHTDVFNSILQASLDLEALFFIITCTNITQRISPAYQN